jgi:hypothetical protein
LKQISSERSGGVWPSTPQAKAVVWFSRGFKNDLNKFRQVIDLIEILNFSV